MERLVVITGLSGSGKSLAANAFEDLGYFCVDNLPVGLIQPFNALIQRSGEQLSQAALVIDAREGGFLKQFPEVLHELRQNRVPVHLLFLDCDDEVLKRRFSESRRPHPLAGPTDTVEDAIREERATLSRLRDLADRIIDTSRFTSHELRAFLRNSYSTIGTREVPRVNLVSFGFKYGVPTESDLVFDVRFLPNPYFVDGLRHLDGRTDEVQAFLSKQPATGGFVDHLSKMLDFLIPLYGAEGKTYLTVGLGCTGGKHRSVGLVERMGGYLGGKEIPFTISHRDLGKE